MHVIDVRGDRWFSGDGLPGSGARVDRVELAKQAGIAGVEQIRLVARRTIEDLGQHVRQRALKDRVGGVHRSSWCRTRRDATYASTGARRITP